MRAILFDATGVLCVGDGPNVAVFDFIESVRNRYTIGMLTNLSSDAVEHFVGPLYMDYFDVILTPDKLGSMKPSRESFERACDIMSIEPSEILFIDDTESNIQSASDIGIQTLKYTGQDLMKAIST